MITLVITFTRLVNVPRAKFYYKLGIKPGPFSTFLFKGGVGRGGKVLVGRVELIVAELGVV